MIHPNTIDLEAFACGDAIEGIDAHVAECEACSHFVAKAKALSSTTDDAAEGLLARALLVSSVEVEQSNASVSSDEAAAELAANDHDVKAPVAKPKRSFWFVASTVITPLAAAAAILLLTRTAPLPQPEAPTTPSSATATAASTQTSPTPVAAGSSGATGADDQGTSFKGSVQIAVVRERAGAQSRLLGDVEVRSGDRLRVEVALDREQAILGAVIADDGAYLEIMPARIRGRGTHYSEKSARIDEHPIAGTIVIGTPEAVAKARTTMKFDGLITMRVQPEGTWP